MFRDKLQLVYLCSPASSLITHRAAGSDFPHSWGQIPPTRAKYEHELEESAPLMRKRQTIRVLKYW